MEKEKKKRAPKPKKIKKAKLRKPNNKPKKSTTKMSGFKKAMIVILALLFTLGVALQTWFVYIRFFAPEKVVSKTFEVGMQTTVTGETRNFMEVLLNRNDNKNGLETFEIKFNYMLDENQEHFYSQGLQYVASENGKIDWAYYADSTRQNEPFRTESKFGSKSSYYTRAGHIKSGASMYNYMSADNYETSPISTNPIGSKTKFKIQLSENDGENVYLMSFKDIPKNNSGAYDWTKLRQDDNYFGTERFDMGVYVLYYTFKYDVYHAIYDHNYMARLIYKAVSTLKAGTNQNVVFEFGDIFDYYAPDDNELGTYTKVTDNNICSKIVEDLKSYYSIKVTVNADGARKASDSMFNSIAGNQNYNSTGDYNMTNYFYGRTVIKATNKDFDYIETETDGAYNLILNTNFHNTYAKYTNVILLKIEIDLDKFKELGIIFNGFVKDDTINYKIYSAYTLETINGVVEKKVVEYA